MGPAAAEAQVRRRTVQVCEDVDVGEIGADEEGNGPQGGAPRESASRQGGADERVADRIYGCPHLPSRRLNPATRRKGLVSCTKVHRNSMNGLVRASGWVGINPKKIL